MADLERNVPIGPGTVFESGSLAKQFTAAALMLLEQQGKISLDDKFAKYLPELTGATAAITIRQVISHVSGIREWRPIATFAGRPEGTYVYTNQDLLDLASRQKALNFDAGTAYSYSNTGYNIATILIERVLGNGQTFQQFTTENILAPLGMTHSRWRDDFRALVPSRALAYGTNKEGGLQQMTPIEKIIGAGGLLTTVSDLLKWNENFVHATVGGNALVTMQQKPTVLIGGRKIYAAGLRVTKSDGLNEVAHSGATGGYRTWLGRYPEKAVSVAVLCNSAQANPTILGRETARLWTGATIPDPTRNAMELGPIVGLYRKVRDNTVLDFDTKAGKALLVNGRDWRLTTTGLILATEDGDIQFEKTTRWTPTASDLSKLAGSYTSTETASTLVLSLTKDSALTLAIANGTKLSLSPTFRDAFSTPEGSILFRRDSAGNVVELSIGDDRVWDLRFKKVN